MPKEVISENRGMNTTRAALQLAPGEVRFLQNIRSRPFYNWNKRRGIEHVLSQNEPINGIFEIDLDNITIPVVQYGGTISVFPTLTSENNSFVTPDPYPIPDPLDPNNDWVILWPIEVTMRALQNRFYLAKGEHIAWPHSYFNADGTLRDVAPGNYPVTNFYKADLYWNDIYNGKPAGTYAAYLVNFVRAGLNDCLGYFVNGEVEGSENVPLYDEGTLPLPAEADATNYRSILSQIRTAIKKLTKISVLTTCINKQIAEKTVDFTEGCGYPSHVRIKDYTNTMFNPSGCESCYDAPAGWPNWDGTFIKSEDFDLYSANVSSNVKINGKQLAVEDDVTHIDCSDGANNSITIECQIYDDGYMDIWHGYRYGSGVCGVYTRTGGCSTSPEQITIEAYTP